MFAVLFAVRGEERRGKKFGRGISSYFDGNKYDWDFKDEDYWYVSNDKEEGKFVGEIKDGEVWNGIVYDKNGNFVGKFVNGVKR